MANLRLCGCSPFNHELTFYVAGYGFSLSSLPLLASRRYSLCCGRYVNSAAEKKGFDKQRVLHCSWHDIIPSEEDLVREPLLRELCLWPPPSDAARDSSATEDVQKGEDATVPPDEGVEETKGEGDVLVTETTDEGGASWAQQPGNEGLSGKPPGKSAKVGVGRGEEKKGGCIEARFEVLQLVNRKIADAIPYLDLCQVMRVGWFLCGARMVVGGGETRRGAV